jgi:outer membrane receptor protein involved in Fe transport
MVAPTPRRALACCRDLVTFLAGFMPYLQIISHDEALRRAACVCWALVFHVTSAGAQSALEPLVVTAGLEDAPDDEWRAELAGGRDLRDLLRMRPNAHTGEAPGTLFSLRGVAQEGVLVAGNRTNPALAVMSGHMPRTTNSLWVIGMPVWDLAELVVEAGPQLFHHGPAAAGGLIRMIPQDPIFEESGRFLAEAGGNGKYQAGTTYNTVLIPDQLALRLNLFADGNDGGVTNVWNDDDRFAASDRLMTRAQLRWHPAGDETTRCDLLLEGTRMWGNPLGLAGMRPDYELFDRKVELNQAESVPADHFGVSIRLESAIDPAHKVESWVAFQDADGYQLNDLDNSAAANWWFRSQVDERRLNAGSHLHHEAHDRNWTLGAYADAAEYSMHYYGRGFSTSADGEPFSTEIEEDVAMAALFARGEIEFEPDWWTFGGLRLDGQRRKVNIRAEMAANKPRSDQERTQSLCLLPELGVEWRGEAATVGLKITRSYQPEGISYAFTLGDAGVYDAARGWEVECYGDWRADSLRISPRLFCARIGDSQVSLAQPGGISSLDRWIINTDDMLRYGAEVELGWDGPGDLYAGLYGGWLGTHVDGFDYQGVRRDSGPLPNAPEWNAGLLCSWKPVSGWFGQTALTWQDGTYSQFSSPVATRIEERLDWSARIGYRWRNLEIYGFGHNLLDRDYALVRRDFTGDGKAVQGSPNLPRTMGIGIAIDW